MRFRCPYCRRNIAIDPGGTPYLAGQVYAHTECCAKRPEAVSPDDVFASAKNIARRVGARARRRRLNR